MQAPTKGQLLLWTLGLCLVLSWLLGWYSSNDHLLQQRLSELQGHLSLIALAATLAARPLNSWLPGVLTQRRSLGLLAFFAALLHTWSAIVHIFGGTLEGVFFLTPDMQIGVALGLGALLLMVPLALTSNDLALKRLGRVWVFLHRAVYGVVALALLHTLSTGVHYFYVAQTPLTVLCTLLLVAITFWIWQARHRSKT